MTFASAVVFSTALLQAAQPGVSVVSTVPASGAGLYIFNRAPLQPAPMVNLPIGSITPRGWLRRQLELDAQGMAGNLTNLSPFLRKGGAWESPTGEGHSGWEEPVYWLRGYSNLGYVLKDPAILANTQRWIEAMIASRRPDGYFGPRELLSRHNGGPDLWPHTLALNILQSWYDYGADPRALELIQGYCRWMATQPDKVFRDNGLVNIRGIEYIATLQWLYNRTGDSQLLDLSKRIQGAIADWTRTRPTPHNVDIAQCFRGPAQYWVQSGERKYLEATRQRYDELMAVYGQFPGGGFASDENIREGSIDPRQGFETCGFAEFMHSFQILTRIEGDPVWAGRAEEIAFNSYPAAMTADHKGLHYVTCANMVSQDFRNRQITFCNGWVKTGFSALDYRCCQHNHAIAWPYYAQELWLATADQGLCASLYAASEVTAKVGDGTPVTILAETDYPFSETITLRLNTPNRVVFPLYLRVPAWCQNPRFEINGKKVAVATSPQSYVVLNRSWQNGDTVTLTFPMQISTRTWPKNQDSISVAYGPLWFSLQIGENWIRRDRHPGWPDWSVEPSTPWNYGLVLEGAAPEQAFELHRATGPVPLQPFTPETVPLWIQAKARRLPNWTLGGEKWIAPLQASPAATQEPIETVRLIPLGAARLRISSFPVASADPSAHTWKARLAPLAELFKVSASQFGDSLEAVNDGLVSDHSDDGGIPRMTWWDHKGSTEWLQYDFDKPRAVSSAAVLWFDDTGRGQCRVPVAWKLLYHKDGQWVPVTLTEGPWKALEGKQEYAARRDEFNAVGFNPVTTDALRLEVRLQEGFSGGVLEWRVDGPR